jgi:hypothetical protein
MVMEILIQGSCCKIIMRNENMEKKFARKTLGQHLFPLEKGCQSYLKIKASREN